MGLPVPLPTIAELAPLVAEGRTTAISLVEDAIARIAANDRQGAHLGAIIRINPQAHADACALDEERARSGVRGPLHGLPVVIKDNIDVYGIPTSSGCVALASAMPRRDAEQTRRLRAAGAIILAKTNMSEFSFEIRSRSSIRGDVRNPFNPAVSAGGSSGGTAAAIAAGFAVAGLGTDTGGSIRTPAAYNGLLGFRPTHGRIDISGTAPLAPSADTIGPIARSVEDLLVMAELMIGARFGSWHAQGGSLATLSGRRIGVLRQAFGACEEIAKACDTALAIIARAGAVLEPVALPEDVLPTCPVDIVDHEFAAALDAYLQTNFISGAPHSLEQIVRSAAHLPEYCEVLERRTRAQNANAYAILKTRHDILKLALDDAMKTHRLDAIAYPTSAVFPTSLDNPRGGWASELASYSGRPAVTLPVGRAKNGVPIGLELLGHCFGDKNLLLIAAAVERATDHRYTPDLFLNPADSHVGHAAA